MNNSAKQNQEVVLSRVLCEPIITEAATASMEKNKYIFKISNFANKVQIKQVIERIYKVKVEKINTVSLPKKARNRGRVSGWKAAYRKAIITLKEGSKIDIFEGK